MDGAANSATERIEAALAGLFPAGVAVAALRVDAPHPPPFPEEAAAITRAVPARRAEFTAGRAAARLALSRLGLPPVAIPAGEGRAPVWPDGVSGSISHAGGYALAAARTGAPLGLDVETDAEIEADLWALICDAEELESLPESGRGLAVRQVFSAKEAIFKAQYPLTGRLIGFDAVTLRLATGGFVGRFADAVGDFAAGAELAGRIARTDGLVLTGVAT